MSKSNPTKRGGRGEDSDRLLEEALQVVKVQSFQMKRCLDKHKLMDALKHASNIICELRTSVLSPKYYYELYMSVADELQHLEMYLNDEFRRGNQISDLYELVQYAGNIVPRLYLLITVGVVFIRGNIAPKKEILKDLVEMCRGVQHPLRGLFLRNYLLQSTKNLLPDTPAAAPVEGGGEGEQEQQASSSAGKGGAAEANSDGNIHDSLEFILLNFAEMNKLWVRMQHQGHSKNRVKRERERQELKLLVGTNLVRLSHLESVDIDIYREKVLPSVFEQIVNCRDVLAQEYLMECVIQVFPDEYHLKTLDVFLGACARLQPAVNVKQIIASLIDRLANFASREDGEGIPKDLDLFKIFSEQIAQVIEARPDMPPQDIVALQVSLTNLGLQCYPEKLEYVDMGLSFVFTFLSGLKISNVDSENPACARELNKLLKIPVDTWENPITLLQLDHFGSVFVFFGYESRKTLALYIAERILEKRVTIENPEQVSAFLDLLSPLITDQQDQPAQLDMEEFVDEQIIVAKLIHSFTSSDRDQQYQILVLSRKHFGSGGENRIKFTLPPLVFAALKLVVNYFHNKDEDEMWMQKSQKILQFSHQTITALAKTGNPELSLRLFLQSAKVADMCSFETISYEFITQALLVYEDEISDSRAQFAAMNLMIATLETMKCFSEENFETISTKYALHSSRLLKKPDQCRAVWTCSQLFWSGKTLESPEARHDGKRVLECLQKSLKIADTCMDPAVNVSLFVEILNRYLYYFEKHNECVTSKYITGLIDLINTNIVSVDNAESYDEINTFYQNTLSYIRERKLAEPGLYEGIEV
eukprot:Nk52_evm4s2152 gene=Nk52_evmTU4s2152